jgi:HIRAN domain
VKNYSIVGMNHRKSEAFVAALKPGIEVTLVREPENKFDKNAVAVWIDGVHVGYIPKNQNAPLAAMIDHLGKPITVPIPDAPSAFSGGASDQASIRVGMSVPAKFVRSPNSGYPMVEVTTE